MTRLHSDPHEIATTIAQLAAVLPARLRASRHHLATLVATGWPASHGAGGGRSGGGHGDPVLSAIIARTGIPDPDLPPEHRAMPGDVADWQTRTLAGILVWLNALLDTCDRTVPPAGSTPADRCTGHIDPTCTELATHAPGHNGLCARCVVAACPACRMRPVAPGRHLGDGRRSCEACYRVDLRASR